MFDPAQTALIPAREVARTTSLTTAENGLRWASFGFTEVPSDTLQHIVEAVPSSVAGALRDRAYYFVPLAIGEPQSPSASLDTPGEPPSSTDDLDTEIAPGFSDELSDRATCHRTLVADGVKSTFISARLMQDRFALAFEFFINIGHQFVDTTPVPERLQALLWSQLRAEVRGETSQDAYESRRRATEAAGRPHLVSAANDPAADGQAPAPTSLHDAANAATAPHPEPPAYAPTSFSMTMDAAASSPVASLFSAARPTRRRLAEADSERPRLLNPSSDPSASASPDAPADPARATYYEAAFADALAIYMLSLTLDLDYADLREREYPLLAAPALADRLRLMADLYPPPSAYEFAIRYRRRH